MVLTDAAGGDSFRDAPKEERVTTEQSKDWANDADLFAIAQDFQHFSSRDVLVAPMGAGPQEGEEPDPLIPEELRDYEVGAPPITSDPPIHTWARRLLLSPFSLKSVSKWEPETRELCRSLIDGFIDRGRADAAVDYAQQIPPRI